MPDWLNNITDKSILQDNMTFVSLYIAIFENMTDYVVSNIKSFLCDWSIKAGKEVYRETIEYKEKIRNRIVDDKGNKDVTKASFLWLVDNGAIVPNHHIDQIIPLAVLRLLCCLGSMFCEIQIFWRHSLLRDCC